MSLVHLCWPNCAQVDAFADGPGSGNPAGVCLLSAGQLGSMTDAVRQKVAAKVNLSETAFIEPVRLPQSDLAVPRQLCCLGLSPLPS